MASKSENTATSNTKTYSDDNNGESVERTMTGGLSSEEDNQKSPTKGVTFRPGDDDCSGHSVSSSRKARQKLLTEESYKRMIIQEDDPSVFYPWSKWYKTWWGISVFWSILTIFFETYQVAFSEAGLAPHDDPPSVLGFTFMAIFIVDILVNFNLAYIDEEDNVICDRSKIAQRYMSLMFWVDMIGVFPFYLLLLAITGEMGKNSQLAQYLAITRLLRLVRLHRVKQLFDTLQYNTHVSFTTLTLVRNFGFALVWTHFAACGMYFIARLYDFDDDLTWVGGQVTGQDSFERYITSLYWSVVTFTTVGYGDFSPVNVAEQIFGMVYMFSNMVFAAWMIGSITLLIVKTDEETGMYRDTMLTLNEYSRIHAFDRPFRKRLQKQVKLYFKGRELADETVLKDFPTSIRRKVLKKLYLPTLYKTHLMKNVRQQFIDSFLTECTVEVFSPGEELLARGSIATDLFLLVDGVVKLIPMIESMDNQADQKEENTAGYASTFGGSDINKEEEARGIKTVKAGRFINDISFFTETPQTESVKTATIVKTLTMNQSAWKMIAQDHPGSVGKILHNLLQKVEKLAEETGGKNDITLTKRMEVLRAGSVYDTNVSMYSGGGDDDTSGRDRSTREIEDDNEDMQQTLASVQAQTAVVACQDLIRMHINKLKDDHTTRFLFACSRGDTATITLMCDQGFDPNSADYDNRTGLMIAAQQGGTEAVRKLLEYQANPNLTDRHGISALYESVKNGHDETMEELMNGGAKLCFEKGEAASTLCQTVFDGDLQKLKRLLKAKIQVNEGDYDKRTPLHIAAAEGSLPALKLLIEYGADLNLEDRWKNTPLDEARAFKSVPMMEFLQEQLKE